MCVWSQTKQSSSAVAPKQTPQLLATRPRRGHDNLAVSSWLVSSSMLSHKLTPLLCCAVYLLNVWHTFLMNIISADVTNTLIG
jgi:hypothetical protein